MHSLRTLAGALSVLLVLGTPGTAQEMGATQIPQDSLRQMISTFQQLQQQVGQVQDSAIQEQQQEVQETVTAARIELNPELEETMDRLPELQQEAMQAQANQDTTRLQALIQEGNRIQAAMTQAQAQVMQQPEIQAELEDFRAELLDAMVEIRPGIENTLARMEQLGARLQATQGAMQGGGSGG